MAFKPNMCFINTSHNSEYLAPLRFTQIGSRWSPTSGTRGTLCEIPRQEKISARKNEKGGD